MAGLLSFLGDLPQVNGGQCAYGPHSDGAWAAVCVWKQRYHVGGGAPWASLLFFLKIADGKFQPPPAPVLFISRAGVHSPARYKVGALRWPPPPRGAWKQAPDPQVGAATAPGGDGVHVVLLGVGGLSTVGHWAHHIPGLHNPGVLVNTGPQEPPRGSGSMSPGCSHCAGGESGCGGTFSPLSGGSPSPAPSIFPNQGPFVGDPSSQVLPFRFYTPLPLGVRGEAGGGVAVRQGGGGGAGSRGPGKGSD